MFYVGDKVRVVRNVDECGTVLHPVGTVGKVIHVDEIDVKVEADNLSFYYTEDMLALVERPLYKEGYQAGIRDAEEAIQMVLQMSEEEMENCFDTDLLSSSDVEEILNTFTLSYIVEQTKKYKDKYNEKNQDDRFDR